MPNDGPRRILNQRQFKITAVESYMHTLKKFTKEGSSGTSATFEEVDDGC